MKKRKMAAGRQPTLLRSGLKGLLLAWSVFGVCSPQAGIFCPAAEGSVDRAAAYFDEAVRLRKSGYLTEARERMQQAMLRNPANPDYHFEMSNIYAAFYDAYGPYKDHPDARAWLDRAARELEQTVMFRPDFLPAVFNLGVIQKRRGEYEKARETFRRVLEMDRDSPQAWMQIGATYEEQGFYDDARDAYENAREHDYYNENIRGAIEDLKHIEDEDDQRRRARAMAESRLSYLQSFRFSEDSHAAGVQQQRYRDIDSTRSMSGAIPFAAMMIVEQFMNQRRENKVEEELARNLKEQAPEWD